MKLLVYQPDFINQSDDDFVFIPKNEIKIQQCLCVYSIVHNNNHKKIYVNVKMMNINTKKYLIVIMKILKN